MIISCFGSIEENKLKNQQKAGAVLKNITVLISWRNPHYLEESIL